MRVCARERQTESAASLVLASEPATLSSRAVAVVLLNGKRNMTGPRNGNAECGASLAARCEIVRIVEMYTIRSRIPRASQRSRQRSRRRIILFLRQRDHHLPLICSNVARAAGNQRIVANNETRGAETAGCVSNRELME